MSKVTRQRGLVGTIVVIVVAIIVLSYLGFDLRKILQSEYLQKNLSYVWDILKTIWENYLARPITFIWNRAVVPLLRLAWDAFNAGLDKLKDFDTSSLSNSGK